MAVGNTNYSNGLAETLIQIQLLPEKLSESLVWNRFCNTRGKLNSNIAIDLYMEHENKYFKEQLKTYRGEYTQAPIDRISKSQSALNVILRNHDTSLSTRKPASHGTDPVSSEDIRKLVKVYGPANLFTTVDGRQHSADLVMTRRNIMTSLSSGETEKWLWNKIHDMKGAHYYKQFRKPAVEANNEMWSDLETSFNASFSALDSADAAQ